MQLVEVVQYMWSTGEIPLELGWNILVLIPKGNTDNQGIGLLDTLYNFMESIIDTRPWASIQFPDVLHRFRAGRGIETATMDIKLFQDISRFNQDSLFLVFFNLRKAYTMVDCVCLVRNLEGYGPGPKMCKLLAALLYH